MKTSIMLLVLVASISTAYADDTLNFDNLLQQAKQGRVEDRLINQQRLQIFQQNKAEQARLLKEAKTAFRQQEIRTKKLEQLFESNDDELVTLDRQLTQQQGRLKELLGSVQQLTGNTLGKFEDSIISAQFPGRVAKMTDLQEKMSGTINTISMADIREVWVEILRDLIESGKTVEFSAPVASASGNKEQRHVTRFGVFTAATTGDNAAYLAYSAENQGSLKALPSQPGSAYVQTLSDFNTQPNSVHPISIDPTRGQLLSALGQKPDLIERFQQGGLVGYVIAILGVIALITSIYKIIILTKTKQLFNIQKKDLTSSNTNNALGRVIQVTHDHPQLDLESLELKLSEAIHRETPKFTQFHGLLKIIAVIAPLMGLLGTVVGMIITFQAITLYGTGDPKLMANGISSALVTTVIGLVVAIPTLFFHNYLSEQAKNLAQALEQQAIGQLALLNKDVA